MNILYIETLKLPANVNIPEALLATAVPEPMATPISAFFRAGASFTPSPVCSGELGEEVEEEEGEEGVSGVRGGVRGGGGGRTHHGDNFTLLL